MSAGPDALGAGAEAEPPAEVLAGGAALLPDGDGVAEPPQAAATIAEVASKLNRRFRMNIPPAMDSLESLRVRCRTGRFTCAVLIARWPRDAPRRLLRRDGIARIAGKSPGRQTGRYYA